MNNNYLEIIGYSILIIAIVFTVPRNIDKYNVYYDII
jgi:hypothetical protein